MLRYAIITATLVASPLAAQTSPAPKSVLRAEVSANAEAEFARVDANKDGQMSRTEIETFQRVSGAARVAARNKALFTELDSDKNGSISQAELAKLMQVPKPDASAVLRVDANKDGQVSLAEHRGAAIETFNRFDANKDGALTEAEVRALAASK